MSSKPGSTPVAAPTSGLVLDVSRFDDAEFGDESVDLEGLATARRGRMQEALLASTASRKADIIVTEDGDLRKKVEARKQRARPGTVRQVARA